MNDHLVEDIGAELRSKMQWSSKSNQLVDKERN